MIVLILILILALGLFFMLIYLEGGYTVKQSFAALIVVIFTFIMLFLGLKLGGKW